MATRPLCSFRHRTVVIGDQADAQRARAIVDYRLLRAARQRDGARHRVAVGGLHADGVIAGVERRIIRPSLESDAGGDQLVVGVDIDRTGVRRGVNNAHLRRRAGVGLQTEIDLIERDAHDQQQHADQRARRQGVAATLRRVRRRFSLMQRFRAQQHDHEQEQHHDRAGVDRDLDHGEERRVEQQEQKSDTAHRHDQEQGAVYSVIAHQHEDGRNDRHQAD